MVGRRSVAILVLSAVVVLASPAAFGLIGQSPTPAQAGEDPTYTATIPNDGSPVAVGIPGPVDGTIGEAFNETVGFSIWHYTNGEWERITDLNRSIQALDAYVITTSDSVGPDTIGVSIRLEPGAPATPQPLEPGWNLVAGTAFTDAEQSFGGNDTLLVLDRFDQPHSEDFPLTAGFESYIVGSEDWSDDAPPVSPFGSYFVYAESATTLTPAVSNVTDKADADAQLQRPAPEVTIGGSSTTTLESANETG